MILVIYHFGFEGRICLLIAPVPVHCFHITFRPVQAKIRGTLTGSAIVYEFQKQSCAENATLFKFKGNNSNF